MQYERWLRRGQALPSIPRHTSVRNVRNHIAASYWFAHGRSVRLASGRPLPRTRASSATSSSGHPEASWPRVPSARDAAITAWQPLSKSSDRTSFPRNVRDAPPHPSFLPPHLVQPLHIPKTEEELRVRFLIQCRVCFQEFRAAALLMKPETLVHHLPRNLQSIAQPHWFRDKLPTLVQSLKATKYRHDPERGAIVASVKWMLEEALRLWSHPGVPRDAWSLRVWALLFRYLASVGGGAARDIRTRTTADAWPVVSRRRRGDDASIVDEGMEAAFARPAHDTVHLALAVDPRFDLLVHGCAAHLEELWNAHLRRAAPLAPSLLSDLGLAATSVAQTFPDRSRTCVRRLYLAVARIMPAAVHAWCVDHGLDPHPCEPPASLVAALEAGWDPSPSEAVQAALERGDEAAAKQLLEAATTAASARQSSSSSKESEDGAWEHNEYDGAGGDTMARETSPLVSPVGLSKAWQWTPTPEASREAGAANLCAAIVAAIHRVGPDVAQLPSLAPSLAQAMDSVHPFLMPRMRAVPRRVLADVLSAFYTLGQTTRSNDAAGQDDANEAVCAMISRESEFAATHQESLRLESLVGMCRVAASAAPASAATTQLFRATARALVARQPHGAWRAFHVPWFFAAVEEAAAAAEGEALHAGGDSTARLGLDLMERFCRWIRRSGPKLHSTTVTVLLRRLTSLTVAPQPPALEPHVGTDLDLPQRDAKRTVLVRRKWAVDIDEQLRFSEHHVPGGAAVGAAVGGEGDAFRPALTSQNTPPTTEFSSLSQTGLRPTGGVALLSCVADVSLPDRDGRGIPWPAADFPLGFQSSSDDAALTAARRPNSTFGVGLERLDGVPYSPSSFQSPEYEWIESDAAQWAGQEAAPLVGIVRARPSQFDGMALATAVTCSHALGRLTPSLARELLEEIRAKLHGERIHQLSLFYILQTVVDADLVLVHPDVVEEMLQMIVRKLGALNWHIRLELLWLSTVLRTNPAFPLYSDLLPREESVSKQAHESASRVNSKGTRDGPLEIAWNSGIAPPSVAHPLPPSSASTTTWAPRSVYAPLPLGVSDAADALYVSLSRDHLRPWTAPQSLPGVAGSLPGSLAALHKVLVAARRIGSPAMRSEVATLSPELTATANAAAERFAAEAAPPPVLDHMARLLRRPINGDLPPHALFLPVHEHQRDTRGDRETANRAKSKDRSSSSGLGRAGLEWIAPLAFPDIKLGIVVSPRPLDCVEPPEMEFSTDQGWLPREGAAEAEETPALTQTVPWSREGFRRQRSLAVGVQATRNGWITGWTNSPISNALPPSLRVERLVAESLGWNLWVVDEGWWRWVVSHSSHDDQAELLGHAVRKAFAASKGVTEEL